MEIGDDDAAGFTGCAGAAVGFKTSTTRLSAWT